MAAYPPSPVLSDCDSLASDELDALLEAQGELSHWPTPPFSEDDIDGRNALQSDSDEELDYIHLTSVFIAEYDTSVVDNETMRTILFLARLPPEVLALSLNIITELRRRSSPCLISSSSGLVLVSALNLAALYSIDHPPKLGEWSRLVCDCRWMAAEIDQMSLQVLSALDWRLHQLSSENAIQQAMRRLYRPVKEESQQAVTISHVGVDCRISGGASRSSSKPPPELKVGYEDGTAAWVNGQLTPEGTPIDTTFDCVWSSSRIASSREIAL